MRNITPQFPVKKYGTALLKISYYYKLYRTDPKNPSIPRNFKTQQKSGIPGSRNPDVRKKRSVAIPEAIVFGHNFRSRFGFLTINVDSKNLKFWPRGRAPALRSTGVMRSNLAGSDLTIFRQIQVR